MAGRAGRADGRVLERQGLVERSSRRSQGCSASFVVATAALAATVAAAAVARLGRDRKDDLARSVRSGGGGSGRRRRRRRRARRRRQRAGPVAGTRAKEGEHACGAEGGQTGKRVHKQLQPPAKSAAAAPRFRQRAPGGARSDSGSLSDRLDGGGDARAAAADVCDHVLEVEHVSDRERHLGDGGQRDVPHVRPRRAEQVDAERARDDEQRKERRGGQRRDGRVQRGSHTPEVGVVGDADVDDRYAHERRLGVLAADLVELEDLLGELRQILSPHVRMDVSLTFEWITRGANRTPPLLAVKEAKRADVPAAL